MKLLLMRDTLPSSEMPPTRGHDLKPTAPTSITRRSTMPPTRGHDLKLQENDRMGEDVGCPPHGGTT